MLLAVLALHLAVVSLIVVGRRESTVRSIVLEPRRTSVRLLAAAPPTTGAPVDRSRAAVPPPRRGEPAAPAARRTDGPDAGPTITSPTIMQPPASLSSPAPAPAPASAAPASSPWPSLMETEATRRAIRESALAPRGEKERKALLTPEAKMTETFGGDGRLVEQDLGNGRRRYWQNGKCTETTATRASQLFPEDTLPKPRLAGACP